MSARTGGLGGRNKLFGVGFLVMLLLFVYVTYAIFTKKFVDYVPVRLTTSNVGLQLPALADVKIRGAARRRGPPDRVRRGRRHALPRDRPGAGPRHPGERVGADRAEDVVR